MWANAMGSDGVFVGEKGAKGRMSALVGLACREGMEDRDAVRQ